MLRSQWSLFSDAATSCAITGICDQLLNGSSICKMEAITHFEGCETPKLGRDGAFVSFITTNTCQESL